MVKHLVCLVFGLLIFVLGIIFPGIFSNPLSFTIYFLYIIFLPGWLIGQILKLPTNELINSILIYFVLGIGFYLVINFLAIVAGIKISVLLVIIFTLLGILFVISFVLNGRKLENINLDFQKLFKIVFSRPNVFFLIPIAIGGFIIWLLALQGPNLNGDPYFHLAIIRKALEGSSLSSRALALTETQLINIAYAFPAWHIFLVSVGKFLSLDVFAIWTNIIFALTIISFFVWYYLAKIIFKNVIWAVVGLTLMLIFTVYSGPGYLFSRLGVPDTLAQLILLPLGWGLALDYILNSKTKILIPALVIAFALLAVHAPHYFYLLISMILFGIIYAITNFKSDDYRLVLRRFANFVLIKVVILVILGITIEIKSGSLIFSLSQFMQITDGTFFSVTWQKFGLLYKYGYLLLPLFILFWRFKNLQFIFTLMILAPLIYWTPLKNVLNQLLSGVFIDRLLANTALYFFVFAFILELGFLLVDSWVQKQSKVSLTLINLVLVVIFTGLVILEIRTQVVSDFTYQLFYDKMTNAWVNNYSLCLLGLVLLLVLILSLAKVSKKIDLEKNFTQPISVFILFLIISFILVSPSFVNAKNITQNSVKKGQEYFLAGINNDSNALNFVQSRIPVKSTILTDGGTSKSLVVLTNQYVAYNIGSAYEKKFQWVFDSTTSDEAKAEIVTDPKWAIDYIYLAKPSLEDTHFKAHTEIYQLIYNNGQTEIYKIIK
ncbi:MAG: hypothetical protein US31_C0002G0083 [Berkelbacteria bacterium GW2011_GWA1_36_9]|uniref:Uncharacterized protein n=1 Tax=Berkelbacteria bacterium GW2011_GWA1_36_9 TaxID=1618331 RepID=A0A0G0FI79_9BACT|nr:MAG: hypothetical protein US31_C0002G0083 [Berkelbacteria bacterium GW2011_GWA1_36_9]